MYVTVKTPVSVEHPSKPPLLNHGDLIVLLNNELEIFDDTSKELLHPHDDSDLMKKTAKYHYKDWPPPYNISSVPLIK